MTKVWLGRRMQPAALSLMLANFLIAATLLPVFPWHPQFHEGHGQASAAGFIVHVTGLAAAISAAMFAWAWWGRRNRMLDQALQLSTILWLVVASIGFVYHVPMDRVLFSLCFAVLAAGSAWLEEGKERCGTR